MNRQVSLAVLIGGIVLVAYGFIAAGSFSSDVSRAFTGTPTDRTMAFLTGGIILSFIGGFGLFESK